MLKRKIIKVNLKRGELDHPSQMVRVTNKKKLFRCFLGLFLLVASCDSNRVFDEYKSLENHQWLLNDSIDFEFLVTDTISKNNLYFNLRNNNQYEFSNLYLITHIDFPNGKKFVDTLQYEMTDKNGKFLGVGISEVKHSRLLYKEKIVFPQSGDYKVSIRQAMRKNGSIAGIQELKGITDFGLRIEKLK